VRSVLAVRRRHYLALVAALDTAVKKTCLSACIHTIYRRSRNPRPSKIAGIAFSIRAVRVADCFAPVVGALKRRIKTFRMVVYWRPQCCRLGFPGREAPARQHFSPGLLRPRPGFRHLALDVGRSCPPRWRSCARRRGCPFRRIYTRRDPDGRRVNPFDNFSRFCMCPCPQPLPPDAT
jgi:hypothetical protein